MSRISDISLVARVTVFHDKRAFNQLVLKYQSPIRSFFAGHILGDKQLSDDLAQETFIKAYVNIGKFRGNSSFSTWLYRIAYNVYYDHLRSNKRTEDIDQTAVRVMSSDAAPMGMKDDIYQALGLLSDIERTCIMLQLTDGQPINKISEITSLPEGTVKSHLARAKKKVANYLKANGYDRR